jgi:ketosteroid isomerase-like protein
MSQEDVEIVRAAIDAWNRRDWDSALRDAAPDVEYDLSGALGPFRGVYGRDEIERAWADLTEGFADVRLEPHEFIEVGEHVVVPWTFHAVGREGVEVESRVTFTFTIRNGSIARLRLYQELEEALGAAGLSE